MRVIELEGVRNVRDFGGMAVSEGRVISKGLFYRGGALNDITEQDRQLLFDQLGISCIIDLRCTWEREAKPTSAHHDVEVLHIPFYDKDTLGIEYMQPGCEGKVIGKDVPCNQILYYGSLSHPIVVDQMRICLDEAFSRASKGKPIYLHCSGGKDRTGIMSLLIQAVLDANEEDILEDYMLTNVSRDATIASELARFLKFADGDEAEAKRLTESHRARPEHLKAFRDSICEAYGSFEEFLANQLNMTEERRRALKEACTELSNHRRASA